MPLLLTFIAGAFILVGSITILFTKGSTNLVKFSIGMAFGVMGSLICLELFPEASELLSGLYGNLTGYVILGICVIVGILLLKVLDLFIPDHNPHNEDKNAELNNLYHIGVVSSCALILHNIIEGMSIYGTALKSPALGVLLTLAVGFHNIPMGIMLTSMFYHNGSYSKRKFIIIIFLVSMSTFIGGFMMMLLHTLIQDAFVGILLSLTLGMLLYIILFELLGEIIHSNNKKLSFLGILVGVLIFTGSLFLE